MKRIIIILTFAVMLVSLTACGHESASAVYETKNYAKATFTELLETAGKELMDAGTLSETEDYSALLLEDITWEQACTYRDQLFQALHRTEFEFGREENSVLEKGTKKNFDDTMNTYEVNSGYTTYVHAVFYENRLLLLIGETIPDAMERWTMLGVPEEEQPLFDTAFFTGDDVSKFVPKCESIDLSTADFDGMPEYDYFKQFYLSELTMEQVEEYVQAALDMGYEEIESAELDGTYYFHGQMPNQVTAELYYRDSTMMVNVMKPGYGMGPESALPELDRYITGYDPNEVSAAAEFIYGGGWADYCYEELIFPAFGEMVGSGNGMDSTGFVFCYKLGCAEQNYFDYIAKMQEKGFIESAEQTETDGVCQYIACRLLDIEGEEIPIWVTIRLQEDYFCACMGLNKVDDDRFPTDPRIED